MPKIFIRGKLGFFLLLCLLQSQGSFAQFTIAAQVPTSGLFTKSQLWSVLVSNSSTRSAMVRLQLTLQDPHNSQTLLTAVTGLITITPGTKLLQYQQVQPVQYTYPGGNIDQNINGFLPIGSYKACYQLSEINHGSYLQLADDCITIEVEPMSPPLLNSPEDQSTVDYLRPSFTWLPPTPTGMFFNLNYDFILSPVMKGQSVTEALQNNLPIYSTGNLAQNFLQYPAAIPALDSGRTYAWQIIAKDQSRYASKSEVWSFTCKKDSTLPVVEDASYVKITSQPSAPSIAYEGVLKAEYFHESDEPSIKVTIANIKNPKAILTSFSIKVKYGQNFWAYDLSRRVHLKEKECYEARIKINGGRDYVTRFYPKYAKD